MLFRQDYRLFLRDYRLLLAAAAMLMLAGAPIAASAQPASAAKPAPYKTVPITLPEAVKDSSFAAFRKRLSAIAEKHDRAALAALIVKQGFFWDRESGDGADKAKSSIQNFATAIGLDLPDDSDVGWDTISIYADDPTAAPNDAHPGVICGPADPDFNVDSMQALLDATQSDLGEWVYPLAPATTLHATPSDSAPVVETLGLSFVRLLPGDVNAQNAGFLRLMSPSGKIGFARADGLASLGVSQICYVKDGKDWKITGVTGDPEQK